MEGLTAAMTDYGKGAMVRLAGFITWGELDGDCGHVHETAELAEQCLRAYCEQGLGQGETTDRQVRECTVSVGVVTS